MKAETQIRLSTSQRQFASLIEPYSWLSKYWDWEKKECDTEALNKVLGVLSHGERILAQFFLSVWLHENQDFDFLDAASVLDQEDRQMISAWITEPFWP